MGVPREGNFRPQPAPFDSKMGPEILYPDPQPPGTPRPIFPSSSPTPEPPRVVPLTPRPTATAELPGFVPITNNVAAGMRPKMPGFKELKAASYRTVVFLHTPGADTSREKSMADKEGLTFVGVESSPEKLSDALAKVNALVADTGKHPIYFFADDARGGAVWYLYFRTVDNLPNDAAKASAFGLGLSDANTDYWLAIQTILSKR
jgi:hypothetical protein